MFGIRISDFFVVWSTVIQMSFALVDIHTAVGNTDLIFTLADL